MGYNILEIIQKYSQFQNFLKQSNQDPMSLLDSELKKRNISSSDLKNLINQAKDLQKLFNNKR